MCTVVVDLRPADTVPVLVCAVRDELLGRPWRGPGRHWDERPELVGGQDLEAGGTWLAVHATERAFGCVLNGVGEPAPAGRRRSRGELPLLAASGIGPAAVDPHRYDPFHLVYGDPGGVRLVSWDGVTRRETDVPAGGNLIVNSGLSSATTPAPADRPGAPGVRPGGAAGGGFDLARAAAYRPRFAAAPRPHVTPDAPVARAWAPWLSILAAGEAPSAADDALIMRREHDGRAYGSSSVTLLAIGPELLRYDFLALPAASAGYRGDAPAGRWRTILPASRAPASR